MSWAWILFGCCCGRTGKNVCAKTCLSVFIKKIKNTCSVCSSTTKLGERADCSSESGCAVGCVVCTYVLVLKIAIFTRFVGGEDDARACFTLFCLLCKIETPVWWRFRQLRCVTFGLFFIDFCIYMMFVPVRSCWSREENSSSLN